MDITFAQHISPREKILCLQLSIFELIFFTVIKKEVYLTSYAFSTNVLIIVNTIFTFPTGNGTEI